MKYWLWLILCLFATSANAVQIPDLDALSTPATGDLYYTVDVSDTTDGASGTGKKITHSNVFSAVSAITVTGTSTLAGMTTSGTMTFSDLTSCEELTTDVNGNLVCSADDAGGSGDDVSIDGTSVTDPDFVSTGDIDFVDTSNTVTANINTGAIVKADLATSTDFGDVSTDGSSNLLIDANAVALATDTTGDFVNSITAGTGLSSTGATSGENISHTISVDDVYLSNSGDTMNGALDVTGSLAITQTVNCTEIETDASGKFICGTDDAGGGGSPGGSDTQVQFNDGGSFGGDAGMTYNKTDNELTVSGSMTPGNIEASGTILFSSLTNCDTIDTDADGILSCGTDASGSGGTANILDLGDDDSNESTDLIEFAVTGDTNSIFTEPTADKLLIAVGNDWPQADVAQDLSCTDCIGATEIGTLDVADDTDLTVNTPLILSGSTITINDLVDADISSSAAISVSKTALVAGTNITLATDTLNVDDAFVLNTGDTMTGQLVITSAGNGLHVTDTTDAQGSLVATFEGKRATPADGDNLVIEHKLSDSGGNQEEFAQIKIVADDVTDTTEDGSFIFLTMQNGTLTETIRIQNDSISMDGGTTEISQAELNRLDGLTNTIMTDDTAITGIDDASLEVNSGTLRRAALTGDVTASAGSNATTIAANSVALATDTTGDFVNSITAGTSLSSTGATSGENISHTISVDDDFVINTGDTMTGRLLIDGSADETQLTIQGHSTQTTSGTLFQVENSSAAELVSVDNDGDMTVTGTISTDKGIKINSSADSAIDFEGITSDPCGSFTAGTIFYNSTSNYFCYCNGTDDLKMNDNTTACF